MKKTMPQVLLLGNGINRAYGDKSWQDLIRALKTNEKISLERILTICSQCSKSYMQLALMMF